VTSHTSHWLDTRLQSAVPIHGNTDQLLRFCLWIGMLLATKGLGPDYQNFVTFRTYDKKVTSYVSTSQFWHYQNFRTQDLAKSVLSKPSG